MATVAEVVQEARRLVGAGQFAQAEPLYRNLVATLPREPELWEEFGMNLLRAGRADEAVACLQKAADLDPNSASYFVNLGAALRTAKRTDEAIGNFQRAIQLSPPTAELQNNLALALKDAGRTDEALAAFDRALAIRPEYANGHFNRSNLLMDLDRLSEAVEGYQRAAELAPHDAQAFSKLGIAYLEMGHVEPALEAYERALRLDPNYPEVRRNRAIAWLVREEYEKGWREYEWREQCEGFAKPPFKQPRWDGSPLAGRTLLVYAEQGLGDTLQFIRYVSLAQDCGGKVLVSVQNPLIPLLKCSGFERSLATIESMGTCDVHCPLMSLPGIVPQHRGRPYWPGPYLHADAGLVAQWHERLRTLPGFKVGIVWAGNPDFPLDRLRSVRLEQFAPLAQVPGVRLISLQKGAGQKQLGEHGSSLGIVNLGDDFDTTGGPFMDTAAVLKNLDLVVTVDTSIAHLAGGLGVKTWVALQKVPDWRWLWQGSQTAWYPSLRLFRQSKPGGWADVFDDIATELREAVSSVAPR